MDNLFERLPVARTKHALTGVQASSSVQAFATSETTQAPHIINIFKGSPTFFQGLQAKPRTLPNTSTLQKTGTSGGLYFLRGYRPDSIPPRRAPVSGAIRLYMLLCEMLLVIDIVEVANRLLIVVNVLY